MIHEGSTFRFRLCQSLRMLPCVRFGCRRDRDAFSLFCYFRWPRSPSIVVRRCPQRNRFISSSGSSLLVVVEVVEVVFVVAAVVVVYYIRGSAKDDCLSVFGVISIAYWESTYFFHDANTFRFPSLSCAGQRRRLRACSFCLASRQHRVFCCR